MEWAGKSSRNVRKPPQEGQAEGGAEPAGVGGGAEGWGGPADNSEDYRMRVSDRATALCHHTCNNTQFTYISPFSFHNLMWQGLLLVSLHKWRMEA